MTYEFTSCYFDDPIVPGRALDIMLPRTVSQPAALFFVHGGGWTGGARANYHAIMRAFNREGYICGSTDYRLVPGATILDQMTDIRHGYSLFTEFLRKQDHPVRVVVHGASAGAHLAALMVLAAPGECGEALRFREMELGEWAAPAALILQATPFRFEPWEDIFPQIWTAMQAAVGVPYAKQPELYERLAPNRYVSASSCPVFCMEAECEHMFFLRHTLEFIEKMHALGRRAEYKVYTNAEHGFFYDVTRRQQKEAFADCLAFIRSL
jgi:acetyl esterase/lipase